MLRNGVGYDLTAVTQALVRLRCPTPGGLSVQFGVAGYTSAFVGIPQGTNYSLLPLTLSIPASDLTNVHLLFSVAVSVDAPPSSGSLLIDWDWRQPGGARSSMPFRRKAEGRLGQAQI